MCIEYKTGNGMFDFSFTMQMNANDTTIRSI